MKERKTNRFYARARKEIEQKIVNHANRWGIAVRRFNRTDHLQAAALAGKYRRQAREKKVLKTGDEELARFRELLEATGLLALDVADREMLKRVRYANRCLKAVLDYAARGKCNLALRQEINRVRKAAEERVAMPTTHADAVAARQPVAATADVDPMAVVRQSSAASFSLTAGDNDPYILDQDT